MLTSKIVRLAGLLGICALLSVAAGCAASGGGPVATGDMKGSGTDGGQTGNGCTPGDARSCICLGGGNGTQVCRDTGTSYGSCTGCSGDAGTITIADGGSTGNPCGDCAGCCDGTACILFGEQSNSQCGATGTTCTSCGSQTCNTADGTCVTQGSGSCSASNCNGCCGTLSGQPHCFVDTTSACGSGGGACTTCQSGSTCSGGACSTGLDPNHKFKVTVETLTIYNTDGSSTCWDNNGLGYGCGQPDPYVCFGYDADADGTVTNGCSTYQTNIAIDNGKTDTDNAATDSTSWSGTDGVVASSSGPYAAGTGFNTSVFYIPGSYFSAGKVLVTVYDYDDVSGNDVIASSYISVGQLFSNYMVGPFGRMVNLTFKIE